MVKIKFKFKKASRFQQGTLNRQIDIYQPIRIYTMLTNRVKTRSCKPVEKTKRQ